MLKLYSISIHPKAGIGYAFASIGENANHALANLSHQIRRCQEKGIDNYRFKETLRAIRKPWRYHLDRFYARSYWYAVTCVPCNAISISYDEPLIPLIRYNNKFDLGYTGRQHFYEEIPPRNKPKDSEPKT